MQPSAQSLHKTSSYFSQDSLVSSGLPFAVLAGATVPLGDNAVGEPTSALCLSSIGALQALKRSFEISHQALREKCAKLD